MFKKEKLDDLNDTEKKIDPLYTRHSFDKPISKYEIYEKSMLPSSAYNLIHDELILDGNSRYNLATFVTTWMEPEARQLMIDTFDKNMIDKDEYPQTAEIEKRCVNILARLWHSHEKDDAMGCSTIGSSEAVMLGGMALKWRWKEKMKKLNKSTSSPNIVIGSNVQICWKKFCRYWEIEPRYVYCEGDSFHLDAKKAVALCDENTIGVGAIMGSTFDGSYEPVEEISSELDKLQKEKGLDISIHVDAASGGFITPFLQPKLKWDFRVPRVASINASGHKYGLVYPGVGWIVWRNKDYLHEDLIFNVDYLGGKLPTFAINFSRPGSQICAQYYNFLRLGMEGYGKVQKTSQEVAMYLSSEIEKIGPFKLISKGDTIPVFAWTLKKEEKYSLYDIAEKIREHGWLVPAYPMPANREDLVVQRIVVKNGFSKDMANMLLTDIKNAIDYFNNQPSFVKKKTGTQFKH